TSGATPSSTSRGIFRAQVLSQAYRKQFYRDGSSVESFQSVQVLRSRYLSHPIRQGPGTSANVRTPLNGPTSIRCRDVRQMPSIRVTLLTTSKRNVSRFRSRVSSAI